ncbi:MAG: hypothetical protein ACREUW_11855 [Burkholderiales bacterium]
MQKNEDVTKETPESRLAAQAWARGEIDLGRDLYRKCVGTAKEPGYLLPPSFYLSEWARMEGTIGNREAFERLHLESISLQPNAPFLRLCYARDTWAEFKDGPRCMELIAELEDLLASDRWDRGTDLAPLAYQKKIETLKAWVRGEPGGDIWP